MYLCIFALFLIYFVYLPIFIFFPVITCKYILTLKKAKAESALSLIYSCTVNGLIPLYIYIYNNKSCTCDDLDLFYSNVSVGRLCI